METTAALLRIDFAAYYTLSLDEINYVANIAGALLFTIEQMAGIYASWLQACPGRA